MGDHVSVIDQSRAVTRGQLLYLMRYPHAVTDANGRVTHFERRVQRCGVVTDAGETWHFTVPLAVEML